MQRRQFLALLGTLVADGTAAGFAVRPAAAAVDRLEWWDPATTGPFPPNYVALEWRYLAGRLVRQSEDFGFVVSVADYNPLPPLVNVSRNELLVMREEFGGAQLHATNTYPGVISYDAATATYSFVADENAAIRASWRLDTAAQTYTLSVASPELVLGSVQITPRGQLIPEGGTGVVSSGSFSYNGTPVVALSDYYADWVTLADGEGRSGLGRLDMQTIRPSLGSGSAQEGFAHHWFAFAATLNDGSRAWVSGWQILTGSTTAWGVTVATGEGASWQTRSVGSDSSFQGSQPLVVTILEQQAIPGSSPALRTGRRWRFQAGQTVAGDLLDVVLDVPPGQFIEGARISVATNIRMQEAVGTSAIGSVGGKPIVSSDLVIVESTFAEPGAPITPRQRSMLPLVRG